MAGKSGTGQKSNEDDYSWFIVYAPYDDPKYVVAALVEEGGYGATSALYAVRDVLGSIYDEPDTVGVTAGDGAR